MKNKVENIIREFQIIENIIRELQIIENHLKEIAEREIDLKSVFEETTLLSDIERAKRLEMENDVIIRLYENTMYILNNNISSVYELLPGIADPLLAIIEQEQEAQERRDYFVTELNRSLEQRKENGSAIPADDFSADWWRQKYDYYMHESVQRVTAAAERTAEIRERIEAYIMPTEPAYSYRDIR